MKAQEARKNKFAFHFSHRIRDEKMFGTGSGTRDEKMVGSGSGLKHPGSATLVWCTLKNVASGKKTLLTINSVAGMFLKKRAKAFTTGR
jgi:hypothetical protein